ncbi:beta-microseminoprotein-like [Macrotis lagotis]|uniref:beta-microseminoprotein-like n=1 Tax=Macrotis lagotis TaxID=92651 RepID=UPI003D6923C0
MLALVLALAVFVTFCDASCINIPLELYIDEEPTGCKDEKGQFYPFETKWTSNCQTCECNPRVGIMCCNMIMKPLGYDKVNCKEVFNKEKCEMTVVKKRKPSETCKVMMYLG